MAAAAVQVSGGDRRDLAFASVFPSKNYTTPTPLATPSIGTTVSPESSFGDSQGPDDPIQNALKVSRAWSAATRFLSLSHGSGKTVKPLEKDPQAERAVHFLLNSRSTRDELRDWYMHEISGHFRAFVLPELVFWQDPIDFEATPSTLSKTVKVLQTAQNMYIQNLVPHAKTGPTEEQSGLLEFVRQVKQDLHVNILNALPQQRIQKTLAGYFFHIMNSSLIQNSSPEICLKQKRCRCQLGLNRRGLRELESIGLGGSLGERALARATHKLLAGPALDRKCFEVDWVSKTTAVERVRAWIQDHFAPAIQEAVSILASDAPLEPLSDQSVSLGLANFGRLRTQSLFDYVRTWPESQGAILDLKEYLYATGTSAKANLCSSFSGQMQRRLLHSGASTVEILEIYVNTIHVFKLLDPRGVLLEKVAIPIRNYLRNRDDTATTIAASFLAEVDDHGRVVSNDWKSVCADITVEIANSAVGPQDHRISNWDDMDWVPDPVDAGLEHKPSGSEDVLSYIIGLFEQEEFVKELLPFLGQHFLRSADLEFTKETKLIELLKSRLDSTKLQAAEVMLKDMRDSKQLNRRINPADARSHSTVAPTPREIQAAIPPEGISLGELYSTFESRMKRSQFVAAVKLVANRRNDLYYPKRTRGPPLERNPPASSATGDLNFHVKVLSGLFWPPLRNNIFDIPTRLIDHLIRYETQFANISGQRRIKWRPALSTMNVVLELEDRTIEEADVPAWRGSVIDLFAQTDENSPPELTVPDLVEALKMEEDLVIDALHFWVGKRVLYQPTHGSYAVLERLDMDAETREPGMPAQQTDAISTARRQDTGFRDGAPMFETFIMNMLRNNGPREVEGMMGITSMLKMVLPTFTYGDEEVEWLLADMQGRGEVAKNGDTWAAAK